MVCRSRDKLADSPLMLPSWVVFVHLVAFLQDESLLPRLNVEMPLHGRNDGNVFLPIREIDVQSDPLQSPDFGGAHGQELLSAVLNPAVVFTVANNGHLDDDLRMTHFGPRVSSRGVFPCAIRLEHAKLYLPTGGVFQPFRGSPQHRLLCLIDVYIRGDLLAQPLIHKATFRSRPRSVHQGNIPPPDLQQIAMTLSQVRLLPRI